MTLQHVGPSGSTAASSSSANTYEGCRTKTKLHDLAEELIKASACRDFKHSPQCVCLSCLLTYPNNGRCTLHVIYNIRAISHLLQEIKGTEKIKREGLWEGGRKKSPTQHVETCVRFRHRQGHPSVGLASVLLLGNQIRRRTATNLFLSQRRCPLGLHAHCVDNTSTFTIITLVLILK